MTLREDGQPRTACALGELAEHIGDSGGGRGDLGFSALLEHIADEHRATDRGMCRTCGMGDTTWPCTDWLVALNAAVEWVRGDS